MALVLQQFGLLPWRNVRDNVVLGLELAGVPRAERYRRADAQLEMVGLADWAEPWQGDPLAATVSIFAVR